MGGKWAFIYTSRVLTPIYLEFDDRSGQRLSHFFENVSTRAVADGVN